MSLNKKLNLTLVLVTTLILSVAGIWNVHNTRQHELQRLQQDAHLILQRLSTTLPQTLWDFAPNQAQIIIDGELNNPLVVAIQITDMEKNAFAKAEKAALATIDKSHVVEIQRQLIFRQNNVDQTVGVVTLFVTQENVFASVQQAIVTRAAEILLLDLILSIALAYSLGRMVMRPLSRVLHNIHGILADRDLSRRIRFTSQDELGELAGAIDHFLDDMQRLISEMNKAAKTLQNIAHSTVDSHQTLHTEIRHQRSAITRLNTAINEIAQTAHEVQHKSANTTDLVGITRQDTATGLQLVRDTSGKIADLSSDVGRSAEAIDQLKNNVDAISQVLDVIVAVAEQTNLLALNAAIEAARAGEMGRGFAVVADEVRSLAQRTRESTREISANLKQLNQSTDDTVTAMRDSVPKARHSIDSSRHTGASIERISHNVDLIQQHAREIHAATENQNSAIVHIEKCCAEIDSAIHQTLNVADATKTLNHNLVATLETLQNLAGRFKTGS